MNVVSIFSGKLSYVSPIGELGFGSGFWLHLSFVADIITLEVQMEVSVYCDKLETQLTGWKAKIYDVIQIIDQLPANEMEAAFSSIRGLHGIVDEIDSELDQLKSACPADWSPNRKVIDDRMTELHATLKTLSEKVGGPLIPDSLLWVSE